MKSSWMDSIFKNRKFRKVGISNNNVPLTVLPREIRLKIWQKLTPTDQKTVRSVCKDLHEDIDSCIGLHGILIDSIANLRWIQSARLQSLIVQTLPDPLDKPYLQNPSHLQKLRILNGILTISNLRGLLKDLSNLKELSLLNIPDFSRYFTDFDDFIEATDGQIVLALTELPLFLSTVASNPILQTLHLDFNTCNCDVVAHREMEEDELHSIDWEKVTTLTYQCQLKTLSIRICDKLGYGYNVALQRNDDSFVFNMLQAWSAFLTTQNSLESFCSSFGVLNWSFYQSILLNCRPTLRSIEILNISSSVVTPSGPKQAELFDWTLFRDFVNLRSFKLSASSDFDFHFMPSTNFRQFPISQLNELELTGIELTEDDVYQALYNTRRQLRSLKLVRNFIFSMNSLHAELLKSIQHRQVKQILIRQAEHLFETQTLSKEKVRNSCKQYDYSFQFEKNRREGKLDIRQTAVQMSRRKRLIRSTAQLLDAIV